MEQPEGYLSNHCGEAKRSKAAQKSMRINYLHLLVYDRPATHILHSRQYSTRAWEKTHIVSTFCHCYYLQQRILYLEVLIMNFEGTTGLGVFASSSVGLPRRSSFEEEEPSRIPSSASIGTRSSLRQSLKRAATVEKAVISGDYGDYSVESVCSSLSKGGSRRSTCTRPKRASSFQSHQKDTCHLPVKRSEHVTWQLRSLSSNRRLAGTSATAPARKYSSLTVTSDDDNIDDVDEEEEEEYEDYDDHDSGKRRRKLANKSKTFPAKLYQMLQEVEESGLADVVSWLSHGRAIRVHDPKRFVDEVMTHYFRQSKITSFQRQLNVYGFRRLVYGRDSGAYHHPLFLRGVPELLCKISRVGKKGTGC